MTDANLAEEAANDALVLDLRCAGRSFASIARALSLRGPQDASAAFIRALRRRSARDRAVLCRDELERLDLLEARVRGDTSLAPFDRDVQLAKVAHLRTPLLETLAP